MILELDGEDVKLLTQLLQRSVSDLRVEIRRTREPQLHDRLADEEERLKSLLERLQVSAAD